MAAPLLPIHPASVVTFCGILLFYTLTSCVLQALYYARRAGDVGAWKSQPKLVGLVGPSSAGRWPWSPLLPVPDNKPGRPLFHRVLCAVNTLLAASAAGFVCEAFMRTLAAVSSEGSPSSPSSLPRGHGRGVWGCTLYTVAPTLAGLFPGAAWAQPESLGPALSLAGTAALLLAEFLVAVVWENVVEYYFHRTMHLPAVYRTFHKLHHAYKSPTPFDDMCIHPFEALLYYCILYSPAFAFPTHLSTMALYMALMGLAGMFDHSGIKIALPYVYHAEDHDLHHELFDVNYGFPFVWLDLLHGTYRGTFWGRTYDGKGPASDPAAALASAGADAAPAPRAGGRGRSSSSSSSSSSAAARRSVSATRRRR
jgi:sterol desaturase/sphingolipid hydroxylase (fatty acid hydroxylase superfamily)